MFFNIFKLIMNGLQSWHIDVCDCVAVAFGAQGELHLIEGEITQLRESNLLQKKRLMETVSSVLKDLAEVGTVFGGELKVFIFMPLSML